MVKHKRTHSKSRAVGSKTIPANLHQFRAFTKKYPGRTNRIVTEVGITPYFDPAEFKGKPTPFQIITKKALWDTGATGSVLTSATARELNLIPAGIATINHVGGQNQCNTYMVNFYLPNRVAIPGVMVSECINSDFDAIIGMDIISIGDLSITNLNNKTWVSFRIPSIQHIDYVDEFNKLNKK